MMKLEELRLTELEELIVQDLPEQVAIGYIRARRKDHLKKIMDPNRKPGTPL